MLGSLLACYDLGDFPHKSELVELAGLKPESVAGAPKVEKIKELKPEALNSDNEPDSDDEDCGDFF